MYSIYLYAYIAFLALLWVFFVALAVSPRKKFNYSAGKGYKPKVLVMVPCKGYDIELAQNLRVAQNQSYKNYDVIAIVDSLKDPALKAIKETRTKFIVFNYNSKEASRKVIGLHNALSKFKNYDAYVILDSDVLTNKKWLERLIAPLADSRVGLSTSYPVFLPVGGFWSKVKHAWGYVGQGLEEDDRTAFGWGGSLAFRKDILDKKSLKYFSSAVSDDLALTRIAKLKGLKIAYVKEAYPVVKSDDNFSRFSEWSNRQTAIFVTGGTRHYGRTLIIYYSSSILLMLSGIALAIVVSPWFLLLLLPQVISAVKLWRRSDYKAYMLLLSFLMSFIYLANTAKALSMRSITWRGTTYSLENIRNMRNYGSKP